MSDSKAVEAGFAPAAAPAITDPNDPNYKFPPPPPGPPPQTQVPAQAPTSLPEQSQAAQAPVPASDATKTDAPYFPPPPGQTPPATSKADEPYFPPPPSTAPPPQMQHPDERPIPDYDPGHPIYAPPPSDPQHLPPEEGPGGGDEMDKRRARGNMWSKRLHDLGAKAAGPINSIANKLGAQSFLPTTLDKECEKAAKILTNFCNDGVTGDAQTLQPAGQQDTKDKAKVKPKSKETVLLKIPQKVIANALGLAIFTTARVGFQISGSTGSGVLVARLPDGTWSPPSGIQVHSLGAGFLIGLDIYDCVCVINNREALSAFMDMRVSLGSEVAVAAGPYGAGGGVDFGAANHQSRADAYIKEGAASTPTPAPEAPVDDKANLKADKTKHRRTPSSSAFKPVFSYVKSRGLFAGISVDGTAIVEREEANAAFYGQRVSVQQILSGQISPQSDPRLYPSGAKVLIEALRRAEEPRQGDVGGPLVVPNEGAGVPAASGAVSAGGVYREGQAASGAPPAYTDDGKVHPTGDQKVVYQ